MNKQQILRLFPNASPAFIAANLSPDCIGQAPVMERRVSDAPLEKKEVQRPTSERLLVRITSIRKRLLDEDNLCEKYHVDLCRYAGIIPDDAPDKIKIEVCQQKARKGQPEQTKIEVFPLL